MERIGRLENSPSLFTMDYFRTTDGGYKVHCKTVLNNY